MERNELAQAIYRASHLTGQFRLRSGATATEYFDKYLFESDPALLGAIVEHLAPLMPADIDALAGLELGGVPIATMLAQQTGLPAYFVRKEQKLYGTCRLVEGGPIAGQRLLIVEDVVSSGGQIALSTRDLRGLGATVDHALCVIDRESGGPEALAAEDVKLSPLFLMSELLDQQTPAG
jgi:orotate phosphoribosyltransferase